MSHTRHIHGAWGGETVFWSRPCVVEKFDENLVESNHTPGWSPASHHHVHTHSLPPPPPHPTLPSTADKNFEAQLTSLFSASNEGRRLSANEGAIVDKATSFLSSAIAQLGDAATTAIEKLEGLTGAALEGGLQKLTGELQIQNSWGADIGGGQFLSAIKDADSLAEATTVFTQYENELCEPWKINVNGTGIHEDTDYDTVGTKIPTKCKGPTIKLEYEPKVCIVSDQDHKIECKPGRLVMTKKPGECTMKHWEPFHYKSKECKASTEFAKKVSSETLGGEPYTLFFDQHDSIFHKAPAPAPAPVTT